jgi:hypothetical protein
METNVGLEVEDTEDHRPAMSRASAVRLPGQEDIMDTMAGGADRGWIASSRAFEQHDAPGE